MKDLAPKPNFDALVQHLKERLGAELIAVYLYGSFAKGWQRSDSDIDLAILARCPLSQALLLALALELTELSGCEVDLIDLRQVPTVLQLQVVTEGKRLLCCDHLVCDLFETHVFSDYVDLNERRAGMLEDIRRRGSVYG